MGKEKVVQLNLVIPSHYRDQLRRMAAERILENPGRVESGASIGAEILLEHLRRIEDREKEQDYSRRAEIDD